MKLSKLQKLGLKRFFAFLLTFSLSLLQILPFQMGAVAEEVNPSPSDFRITENPYLTKRDPPGDFPKYLPGKLIIKLKEGHELSELDELRQKYRILSAEEVFPPVPSAEENLAELKKKREALENPDHSGWYWWSDKDSREYKDYAQRAAKEKEDLDRAIRGQEELIARLAARQKRAPEGAVIPSLEGIHLLKASPDADVPSLVAVFQAHPAVAYAEPNYIMEAALTPNDPNFTDFSQWGPRKIKADLAWDTTTGSDQIIIAIIDTGVDYTHRDLAANIWTNPGEIPNNHIDDDHNLYVDDVRGWDFVNNDNDPMDDNGHGTHCAGIASAMTDNGNTGTLAVPAGIAGISWKSKIMAVKLLRADRSVDANNAAKAIYYAVDRSADILSNSWGKLGPYPKELRDAIDYAYSQGCVIVGSAGNAGVNTVAYPAGYEHVISVAATDSSDRRAVFSSVSSSNYGPWIDVAAPGKSILSTVPSSGEFGDPLRYKILNGTSMACPHVSGLAALILSRHPGYQHDQIAWLLKETVRTLPTLGNVFSPGFGLIDASRAVGYTGVPPRLIAEISGVSVDWNTRTVSLWGTATGDDFIVEGTPGYSVFSKRILQYSVDGQSWQDPPTPNFKKSGKVNRGELFSWHIGDVPNEILFLRLLVTTPDGRIAKAYSGPPDFSLATPSNLLATPASSTRIDLTWTDNANNETGFKVYRKDTVNIGGFDYTVGQPAPSVYSLTTGIYTYYFTSGVYLPVNYVQYVALSGPLGPYTVVYAVTYDSALDKYTFKNYPPTVPVISYVLKLPANGDFNPIATLGPNSVGYSDTALVPNTLYSYKVLAYNDIKESAYSNVSQARTFKTPPAAPSRLTAISVLSRQITLTWVDNATNEDGFMIYRRRPDLTTNFKLIKTSTTPNVTTYIDTEPYSGKTYDYQVSAYNNGGESPRVEFDGVMAR